MSEKGRGAKIVIQFTDDLTGEIAVGSGGALVPAMTSNATPSPYVVSASTTNTGESVGAAYGAFDGKAGTFWHSTYPITIDGNNPVWLKIHIPSAARVGKYVLSARSGWADGPRDFLLQGSNDDSSWTTIDSRTGISWAAGQTQEFTIGNTGEAYLWFRLLITNFSRSGVGGQSFASLAELQMYEPVGVSGAFIITGNEFQYVGGPLINKTYQVLSVERYPNTTDRLLLTMQPTTGRFNNVEGQLTVTYSSALGQLAGRGGLVADFTRSFTPTELEPVPHQNDAENIEIAGISVTATRTRVYYTNGYGPENIELASISATGTLTHIDDL